MTFGTLVTDTREWVLRKVLMFGRFRQTDSQEIRGAHASTERYVCYVLWVFPSAQLSDKRENEQENKALLERDTMIDCRRTAREDLSR